MREAEDPRIAQLRDVFDGWARDGRAEGMERGHGVAARRAFDLLELPARAGTSTSAAATDTRCAGPPRRPGRVGGGDRSLPAMVERARTASRGFPNIEFQVAAFPDSTLPHGCFDAVLSMEVVYYLPDLDAALGEIARLLVPADASPAWWTTTRRTWPATRWPEDLGVEMTLLDATGWRRAMERVGLLWRPRRESPSPPPMVSQNGR
jgi:SAM-dependent methyltransferase